MVEEIIAENVSSSEENLCTDPEDPKNAKQNKSRKTMRYIVIKTARTKERDRLLKVAREKQNLKYKGNNIKTTSNLTIEILRARREWGDKVKVLNEKESLLCNVVIVQI